MSSMTAALERATPMEVDGWYRPAEPRARPMQRFDLLGQRATLPQSVADEGAEQPAAAVLGEDAEHITIILTPE
jgi:hypothetical protein